MKVSITFTDGQDGKVEVKMEFDPALTSDTEETPALRTAMVALDDIKRYFQDKGVT